MLLDPDLITHRAEDFLKNKNKKTQALQFECKYYVSPFPMVCLLDLSVLILNSKWGHLDPTQKSDSDPPPFLVPCGHHKWMTPNWHNIRQYNYYLL